MQLKCGCCIIFVDWFLQCNGEMLKEGCPGKFYHSIQNCDLLPWTSVRLGRQYVLVRLSTVWYVSTGKYVLI